VVRTHHYRVGEALDPGSLPVASRKVAASSLLPLPGGGVALIRSLKALNNLEGANEDQTVGIAILRRAIQEPLRQIVENVGDDAAVILNRVKSGKGAYGYNAATGEFGDMLEAGILEPTKVTRLALQNAASVAGVAGGFSILVYFTQPALPTISMWCWSCRRTPSLASESAAGTRYAPQPGRALWSSTARHRSSHR
jgi:hypothetical protein